MKDYSKTIMYKIIGSGMTYYGHTIQKPEKRKSLHIFDAKANGNRCTSKRIINAGDWEMIEIEKYPCANLNEAKARERWWIENHECVNKYIPLRTPKEYTEQHKAQIAARHKAYNDAHKVEKVEYDKAYRIANKDHILAYTKAYDETHRVEKAAYYQAHKAHISARQKAYDDTHKVEKAAYMKGYSEAHKAEKAEYREGRKAEKAEYDKAYRQYNKLMDGLNKIKV